LHYRRGIDAELIGWKKNVFVLKDKMTVEHNDLYERYQEKDFEGRGNVSIMCLLEHI
jgi:hypothetical protein